MRFLKRALINTSKEEIIVNFSGISVFALLLFSKAIPRLVYDVLFFSFASASIIYFTFYSKSKEKIPIKSRLLGAMVGGAFIWQLIEASSKLFAKWAVCSFF